MKSRLILLLMVLGLVFTPLAWGQQEVYDLEGISSQEELLSTTLTAAVGFTSSKVCVDASGGGTRCAKSALISVKTAGVNCSYVETPTVSTDTDMGHTLNAGDSFFVRGAENVKSFKCINLTASNGAKVFVTLFY